MSPVSLKRHIIRRIEAMGGYRFLGFAGSILARRISGQDVGLFFDDGLWVRRIGGDFIGDKPEFNYYLDEFRTWPGINEMWLNSPKDYWFHSYTPKAGDTVVDVGAGFGNDSLQFSRNVGPDGRVLAIEAHPVTHRRLAATIKWNRLANVVPLMLAVGNDTGTIQITESGGDEANILGDGGNATGGYEIPLVRLDDLLEREGVQVIDLLKMNIEGAETDALRGMMAFLERTRNAVVSCHDFRTQRGESEIFTTLEEVSGILKEAGFTLERRLDDSRDYIRDTLYASRKHVSA